MKIATILGTRQDYQRAPIIAEIDRRSINQIVFHTGQHYDNVMSDNFLRDLELSAPDSNIHVGLGTYGKQTILVMKCIEEILRDEKQDIVLV